MQQIGPTEILAVGKLSFMAVIVLIIFAAFVAGLFIRLALPRLKSSATGWFVLFGLVLFGLMFFGIITLRMEHHVQPPIEVIASTPHFVHTCLLYTSPSPRDS